ncbi:MAG: hypothetical protein C4527_23675 [Candidatus Omnitrophota bacterium]|jgi:hypothetical protein|nr:MAG: hypothetical protein C4527_23675 [Candidatus Omnitrophota bacterium]
MDTRMNKAVAWKEYRQMIGIVVAFIFITFLMILQLYLCRHPRPYHVMNTNKALLLYAFIGTACLSFLLAAGNRVIEASQGLESFLFVRPIRRFKLFKTYYITGFLGWLIWATAFLVIQSAFFGVRTTFSDALTGLLPEYLRVFTVFVVVYSITFCVGLLKPNLTITVTTCLLSFVLVMAVSDISVDSIAQLASRLWTFVWWVLPFLTLFLLFAGFLFVTYWFYERRQVG